MAVLWRLFALIAVIAAVLVGVVGKCAPELFLRVPNGFYLWAITGNKIPPLFDDSVWEEPQFSQFAKPGDVIVSTGNKAGSFWLLTILHTLRTNGTDSYSNVLETCGMMEAKTFPEQTFTMRLAEVKSFPRRFKDLGVLNPDTGLWWGHAHPGGERVGMDPRRNLDKKYIVIVRNGKEVVRSFYSFQSQFTPEFRQMWGGFPPSVGEPEAFMKHYAAVLNPILFDFAGSWWKYRNDPNVLLLRYADLRNGVRGSMRRIAGFLQLAHVDDETIERSARVTSLTQMKKSPEKYCAKFGRPGERQFCHAHEHLRSGSTDAGRDFFRTPETLEKYSRAAEQAWGPHPRLSEFIDGECCLGTDGSAGEPQSISS